MKSLLEMVALLTVIWINGCNTTEPLPPPETKPTLALELDDASCTEAWLQLKTTDLTLPAELTLKQYNQTGDSVTQTFSLSAADTLLYVDSLLPNQTYKFKAILNTTANPQPTTNQLTVTTMDTTSHNFTWQTFTFGQHQHSVLYDVAVIDENNIWAVGEIYMNDSLGNPDPNLYNLIKWDGINWKPERVYYNYQGSNFIAPLHSIFTFAINDVWVGSNQPMHWNGNVWQKWDLLENIWNGWINNIWGSSSNDLYIVGNAGNIAHYGASSVGWKKIESGTTVDLFDVFGTTNSKEIWSCGYTDDYGTSSLIRIINNTSEIIFEGLSNSQNNGYYVGPMSGIWSDNNHRIFLMNWGGIYLQKTNNQFFLEKEVARFSDVGFGIDGTAYNNVFACGEGFVGHWNGYSYTEYPELFHQQRAFKSVKANTNTVCAVGLDYNSPIYSNAVIVFGK